MAFKFLYFNPLRPRILHFMYRFHGLLFQRGVIGIKQFFVCRILMVQLTEWNNLQYVSWAGFAFPIKIPGWYQKCWFLHIILAVLIKNYRSVKEDLNHHKLTAFSIFRNIVKFSSVPFFGKVVVKAIQDLWRKLKFLIPVRYFGYKCRLR